MRCLREIEVEIPTRQSGAASAAREERAVLEILIRSHLVVNPNIEALGVVTFTQGTSVK